MMDFGIPHYDGCDEYKRLIDLATNLAIEKGDTRGFYKAVVHREECHYCIRLNAPLEVQLFGKMVTVTHVSRA